MEKRYIYKIPENKRGNLNFNKMLDVTIYKRHYKCFSLLYELEVLNYKADSLYVCARNLGRLSLMLMSK